ncbi:hypothetical protein ZEAMMB73_Zm00001d030809 [Zea mays]|uniref:Uncharacterized protein n=1 Tax=Zea mays TaxID=4577 RepID=A0A1D6KEJ6_MAIZE|nr:hypothetical protein ZEAMMB73_Zm00001d030809 [Zea mays]
MLFLLLSEIICSTFATLSCIELPLLSSPRSLLCLSFSADYKSQQ